MESFDELSGFFWIHVFQLMISLKIRAIEESSFYHGCSLKSTLESRMPSCH